MSLLEKTYDPKIFEKRIYGKTEDLFKSCDLSARPPSVDDIDLFSILMPPPNVTGNLHLGHALTYTLQDILIRFHRQMGKKVLWQPGFDHAGIATQMVVERMLFSTRGVKRSDLSRDEFIKETMLWKDRSSSEILAQQKTLGCSASWDFLRFTMDEGFTKAVVEAFVSLYKHGLIYREKSLVNWDIKFKTAISDLEIINKEEKGVLWYIKYKIVDENKYITVATTRPETMFGDTAIAVHPDDERYQSLVGKFVCIPYSDRMIRIIPDDLCDKDKGSGALKVTPAHSHDDFAIGKRHNLEFISIIDEGGHLENISEVPEFLRGVFVKKARKLLLEKLRFDGILEKEEEITHSIPYGDRSQEVVEPLLRDQWFVDAEKLAEKAIQVVNEERIRFVPEKWENTYFDWMKNIRPWCISRQITWGHQIPVWYCPDGRLICERTEEEAFQEAEKLGFKKEDIRRDQDVLDTWFSSALWSFATFGWPERTEFLERFNPTSVLVTGFDIIFFWVARMIMMSLFFVKKVPFRDVYIHALVRDEKGQKMSKSKGNIINPMDLIDEFGADALRFTLAFLSVPGRDIRFGRDHVKVSRNFITKIWNAARFLQYKEVPFDKSMKDLKITKMLNKWLVLKLKSFKEEITCNMAEYRFDYASHNIQFFIRDIFCDFFVEAVKISDDDEIKAIAGCVFIEFLRVAHPFIPFVTDYLANVLKGAETLMLPAEDDFLEDIVRDDESVKKVDEFVELIHQARSQKQLTGEKSDEYINIVSKLEGFDDEIKLFSKLVTG